MHGIGWIFVMGGFEINCADLTKRNKPGFPESSTHQVPVMVRRAGGIVEQRNFVGVKRNERD